MSEELKNQPAVDTGAAEEVSEQVAVRMDKMHKLEEKGILPFGHAYKVTHHNKEVHDKVKELEEKGTEVRVAGRLTAIRGRNCNSSTNSFRSTVTPSLRGVTTTCPLSLIPKYEVPQPVML